MASVSNYEYITFEAGLLEALVKPLHKYGWMVTEAVFEPFAEFI